MQSDAELVAAYRNGSDIAFEELLRRYRGMVHKIAGQYFAVGWEHKDLALEAEVGIWQAALTWNGKIPFKSWVALVSRRKVLTLVTLSRRVKHRALTYSSQLIFYDEEDVGEVLPDVADSIVNMDRINGLLNQAQLSPLEREVLVGVAVGGGYQEIALELGLNKKQVDNLLQKARRKVRVVRDCAQEMEQTEWSCQASEAGMAESQVWKKVYDYLVGFPIGAEITWRSFEVDMGITKEVSRSSIKRAKEEMLQTHGKTLSQPEPWGYYIVPEQLSLNRLTEAEIRSLKATG